MNTRVLKNPWNWLIVWLMLLIVGVLGHLALAWGGVSHSPQQQ